MPSPPPAASRPVRKVVLPVAGIGTRFLPATKTIPKEMLPIVDVPTVQINVEECVASGIEEIIFVTARGKQSIEDHFDRNGELEALLERRGKTADLESIRRLSTMAKFTSVRQAEARGLGHAVLCAKAAVGDEPFAVLLGDDLLESKRPGLRQLVDVYQRWGQGVVGLKEVPVGQEHLYGIIEGELAAERDWKVRHLVEKPAPGTAPSRLAVIGRYVLPPEIFPILENTPPGRGGEIQLTDALEVLCQQRGLHGLEVEGLRFDAGDRAGYVLAVLYYALRRQDIGAEVRAGALRLLEELGDGVTSPLLEVAVTLPVRGTFTYRDPRAGVVVPVGTQVVVPFGSRTVTGFVVGHAAPEPDGATAASGSSTRDIEAVVAGERAFDDEMIGFCRWTADYYQAPLGEVLRAALPQGEKATAVRSVRLTEAGRRALLAQPALLPGHAEVGFASAPPHDVLAALAAAGGELTLKALSRLDARAPAKVNKLAAQQLVEIGDEVLDRKRPRTVSFALVLLAEVEARRRIGPRAAAKRALFEKLAAVPAGLPATALSAAERGHLKALVAAGAVRIEQRPPVSAPAPAEAPGDAAVSTSPPARGGAGGAAIIATPAQERAIGALVGALAQGFATFVLHGVTGSGKTEVYLRVIAEARRAGRGALVLVPEIALTPQLAGRFRARFGEDVAVLHSALPPGERLAAWRRLRAGQVGIAVGARSAVFAPVQRLGVVVVDEEHDGSFKQDDGVRYNARDLAVVRAQRTGAIAILGSATPSLETFRNADVGRFRLLALPERATPRPLPSVEIVNLRRHPAGADGLLTPQLAEAMAANLAAREQTILFLNRRGFSTVVLCRACGHVVRCEHCAVSMTYHQSRDRLVCHYCARMIPVPSRCPSCASPKVDRLGMGTERVEALVRARFPEARVARLDRDTADRRPDDSGAIRGLGAILKGMQAGAIDILVGTQMVTKGHDFAGVTLVGVLQPDQGMHLPDFRATERTFQLLEQVAGRAGRGDRPGRVIIQTYAPEHPAITCVRTHDYEGFVRQELELRREAAYPPFTRMIVLRLDGRDEARVAGDAALAAAAASAAGGDKVRVLGPAEAPIARVRGRSRYQIWLSGHERGALVAAARAGAAVKLGGDVRLAVDIDPQSAL